jgi:hypothetical protein
MKDEGQRETSEWGVDDFGAVALSGVGRTRRRRRRRRRRPRQRRRRRKRRRRKRRRRRRTTKPFAEIVV